MVPSTDASPPGWSPPDPREAARARARALAAAHHERGDATGWFETLYAAAGDEASSVPWADLRPHPLLQGWPGLAAAARPGARALVVGCGLGDDAVFLADRGMEVVAFDLAPSAVAWCRRRFPRSGVDWDVADAREPPPSWRAAFDLVVEIHTLQALPADLRPAVMQALAGCLSPGGRLLVVTRGREPHDPPGELPWPLTRAEFAPLEEAGLLLDDWQELLEGEPPVRRFRASFRRAPSAPAGGGAPGSVP